MSVHLLAEIEKILPQIASCERETVEDMLSGGYEGLSLYHLPLGMDIKSRYLQKGGALRRAFEECGITRPDDMVSLILELLYVHGKEKSRR